MPESPNGNSARILGISADRWFSFAERIGVPGLFMCFVCYMAYQFLPPIAAGHLRLLERTGDTLESMDEKLGQFQEQHTGLQADHEAIMTELAKGE